MLNIFLNCHVKDTAIIGEANYVGDQLTFYFKPGVLEAIGLESIVPLTDPDTKKVLGWSVQTAGMTKKLKL